MEAEEFAMVVDLLSGVEQEDVEMILDNLSFADREKVVRAVKKHCLQESIFPSLEDE
jgi:hypothetical protein